MKKYTEITECSYNGKEIGTMVKTPDFKYPQKGVISESTASAEYGFVKAAAKDCGIGGGAGAYGSASGAGSHGHYGKYRQSMSHDNGFGIRYCRLVTDAFDDFGRPIRCYSVLAFRLEAHVVIDSTFIYDVTRSRLRFERLIRVARREQLEPAQLRYLVEDMVSAGLL